ncbi:MAG: flagellar hook-basal body complex protein FliE [Spirochaetales bacterium]|nr:flagellar hook-basal body complex protein FliE [Spirochaetales bacterium]
MYSTTPISAVKGNLVTLQATNPKHFGEDEKPSEGLSKSFGQLLFDSLNEVSSLQNEASQLSVEAIINPDEVAPHDVTIAMAKANMSLSIAKNVMDRVIQGYKDLTNLR